MEKLAEFEESYKLGIITIELGTSVLVAQCFNGKASYFLFSRNVLLAESRSLVLLYIFG